MNDIDSVVEILRNRPDTRSSSVALGASISKERLVEIYREIQKDGSILLEGSKYPEFSKTFFGVLENRKWIENFWEYGFAYPLIVEMHLGLFCNGYCSFCFSRDAEYEEGGELLSHSEIADLFTELYENGVQEIWFSGGKEPFTAPLCVDSISMANAMGFKTRVYTNGSIMDEYVCEVLLGCDQIRISASAASQLTYGKIHGEYGASLEDIISNVKRLLNMKRDRGSSINVGISCIIFNDNCHEIFNMVDLWRHVGVDFIQLRGESVGQTTPLSGKDRRAVLEQISRISKGSDLGIRGLSEDDILSKDQFLVGMGRSKVCRAGVWKRGVDPFGNVWHCEFTMHPGNRFGRSSYRLGSLRKQTFGEIIRGSVFPVDCGEPCQQHEYGLNIQLDKLFDDLEFGISFDDQPWSR